MTRLPTVLVLASGRGARFAASGGRVHKLQAGLAGKPVLQHTLDSVRASGLPWHLEDVGHAGMGDSIAAAVHATADAEGWLILPGDLPLVQPQTLRQIALTAPSPVTVPRYQGQRGHPVRFSATCGPELINLTGEKGAAPVLLAYAAMDLVAFVETDDVGIVTDIDTLADLQRAHELLAARQGAPRA
jgi:molybdenum cofactor cytidylyltransferase